MPKVSVIMGAYNCEDTVSNAVDSILAQTYEDWEFIICDDASTDNTLNILKKYEKENSSKIIVLHNESNKMLAGALNECLKKASGEYIARMDADDLSAENRLQLLVDFLDNNPDYAVVGSYMQTFDENGRGEILKKLEEPSKFDVPKSNPFHHATIMMRKSAYDALNGYTVKKITRRSEDVDLWYRFFAAGFKGYNLEQPLYYVKVDDGAYKRRKLKYMIDASKIVFNGVKMLKLPAKYYVFALKPIISWFVPQFLKTKLRNKR